MVALKKQKQFFQANLLPPPRLGPEEGETPVGWHGGSEAVPGTEAQEKRGNWDNDFSTYHHLNSHLVHFLLLQPCNRIPCPGVWSPIGWSPCTATAPSTESCFGERTRKFACRPPFAGESFFDCGLEPEEGDRQKRPCKLDRVKCQVRWFDF